MSSSLWKPCDQLTLADFEAHPVWTFDLSREHLAGSDETFVRPFTDPRIEAMTDEVFLRATFTIDGRTVEGAATAIRPFVGKPSKQAKLPALNGLIVFDPYDSFQVTDAASVEQSERYSPGRFGSGSLAHRGEVRGFRQTQACAGMVAADDGERLRKRLGIPVGYHAKFRVGVFAIELSGTIDLQR